MNFKDVENFQKISQYKSFSIASQIMGVSQPTLSESVKKLENELGVTLFYRSKKGIKLTPQGHNALKKAIGLLNLKSEMSNLVTKNNELAMTYRIGTHPIVGSYFLKDFLKKIDEKHPNMSIEIDHGRSMEIQTLVQNGDVDIAIVVNPVRNPDLIIKKICSDEVCIWRASGNKRVDEEKLIADIGLIQTQSILRKWKNPPSRFITTNDFHLIGELAEAGIGHGILPAKFVNRNKLKLRQVFKSNFFSDNLSIIYRPEFGKSPNEKFLIKTISQTLS